MKRTLVYRLASLIQARANCLAQRTNLDHYRAMAEQHEATLADLVKGHMPHGSGFDNGTTLDVAKSDGLRLVFHTSFHHMTEGFYDGWTEHTVTIVATLTGFDVKVSGRNRNEIKEHVAEEFSAALTEEIRD